MIAVENITYRYYLQSGNDIPTLNRLSLDIEESESVALVGPNGSGKSTLARCLNGLLVPQSGRILIDGLDTADLENKWQIHRRSGMIFQNPDNQLVSTTVEREIAFGLENLGLPSQEIYERVAWTLDRFQMGKYRDYPPHRLSGGEKQRLAIASVVAMHPRYLICDEPTSLLDPGDRRDILRLLMSIVDEHEMSVVFITQSPEEAAQMDRIIVLSRGEIVTSGEPETVYLDSKKLTAHGLEAPLTTRLSEALRMRGIRVPAGTVHPESLVKWLSEQKLIYPNQSKGMIQSLEAQRQSHTTLSPHTQSDLTPGFLPDSSPIIEFDQVDYTYSPGTSLEIAALRDVTTRVFPGQCVALTGSNGSGKSTMIQHLNRLLEADSGTVRVDGVNVASSNTDLKNIRQKVGLVFQFPEAQLFEETVFDDVAFGPRQMGIEEEEVSDMVTRALERVELDPSRFSQRHPLSLSGGEKRRAAIAGILVMQPSVLALDEPTCGLDPSSVRQVEDIFNEYCETGATLFLITHDMDLVSRLSDRILLLENGRIISDSTPSQFFTMNDFEGTFLPARPGLCDLLTALSKSGFTVDPSCFDLEDAANMIQSCILNENDNSNPKEYQKC